MVLGGQALPTARRTTHESLRRGCRLPPARVHAALWVRWSASNAANMSHQGTLANLMSFPDR
jgi:hypothetical protein